MLRAVSPMTPIDRSPIDLEEFRTAMRESGIEEIVEPMLELFASEAAKGMAAISTGLAAGDLDAVAGQHTR